MELEQHVPPNMPELGREVLSPQGVKVLGTPVGTLEFIEDVTQRRLEEERRLWEAIPSVPDLQCAWQILLQCAGPRCHQLLRILPPSVSASYATGHDTGMHGGLAWRIARRSHPEESGPHALEFAQADGRFGSEICVQDGCSGSVCFLGFVGRRDAHDL